MEKNLIARKFIKEIIYSPEEIKISFYYKEKPKELLKKNRNARRQASAKSGKDCKKEKDRKRKKNKFVKNSLAPRSESDQTFSIILPNSIHKSRKKNLS